MLSNKRLQTVEQQGWSLVSILLRISLYEESYRFFRILWKHQNYVVLALLPSYLEREGSSLIYMVEDLIKCSNHPESGFYLHNHDELKKKPHRFRWSRTNVILIGVTYALLDLIEKHQSVAKHHHNGNGRDERQTKRNDSRRTQSTVLAFGFMSFIQNTGWLSYFRKPIQWRRIWMSHLMQIIVRDTEDALTYIPHGKTGGIV
jgi:hypothetical protein